MYKSTRTSLYCYFSIKENSLKLVVLLSFGLYLKLVEWPLKPIKSYWFSYLNCLCLFMGLFISPLKYFKSILSSKFWRYHRTIKQGSCLFWRPNSTYSIQSATNNSPMHDECQTLNQQGTGKSIGFKWHRAIPEKPMVLKYCPHHEKPFWLN